MHENRQLSSTHPLFGKRVAIIGAGPAGLTLARLLQMHGVELTVYERDDSSEARGQGGSLDLHEDSGQLALKKAGLEEHFRNVYRPEGQLSRVFDQHGVLRLEFAAEDEEESRPEIDRGDLRSLLLNSLASGTVQWGMRMLGISRIDYNSFKLVFDGHETVADVVFGCDGGWSKVRPLVSDVTLPSYTGVTFVQTLITDAERRCPAVAEMVGPGNVLALGNGKGLLAQRNGDGTIRVYIALHVPEDWTRSSGLNFTNAEQVRAYLLGNFQGWAVNVLNLLRPSDDIFQPWPLYHYPPRQRWKTHSNVTLLGDAAHIMPPFTGRGANFAMLDAVELAETLTSDLYTDLGEAISAYEAGMLKRMEPAMMETLMQQNVILAMDAPDALVASIER